MLVSVLSFNEMSGIQGWFWFYCVLLQYFSNCEACQSTETRVKTEEKGFFFSLHCFHQFTKDLEKSGTSDKREVQYDYISFPDCWRWTNDPMLKITSQILSCPSFKISAGLYDLKKKKKKASSNVQIIINDIIWFWRRETEEAFVRISNATNIFWVPIVCWAHFKRNKADEGSPLIELNKQVKEDNFRQP